MSHSLGVLIKILRQNHMELVVDKLIEFSGGKDEELRDISGLGMKLIPCCVITLTLRLSTQDDNRRITTGWQSGSHCMCKIDPKASRTTSKRK